MAQQKFGIGESIWIGKRFHLVLTKNPNGSHQIFFVNTSDDIGRITISGRKTDVRNGFTVIDCPLLANGTSVDIGVAHSGSDYSLTLGKEDYAYFLTEAV